MIRDLLHGGALNFMQTEFPDAPTPWVDLSTGVNPWAYPIDGLAHAALQRLPTQKAGDACRMAMARAVGAAPESILLAPGSELLIRLLPFVIAPRNVAVLSPTYGDHARAWRAANATVVETHNPLEAIDDADAIVLCNPNNPDGRTFAPEDLTRAAECLAARGGWLILDEAYADLYPTLSMAAHGGRAGLIVLRSFGKFFGLPGLRLGALIAPHMILEKMAAHLGVWPVSGPALEIGAKAYNDASWQANTRATLSRSRERLDRIFTKSGLHEISGVDLFRYVRIDNATAIWRELAQAGIYVRRFCWSEDHLRIGLPHNAEAEQRLAAAFSP